MKYKIEKEFELNIENQIGKIKEPFFVVYQIDNIVIGGLLLPKVMLK